jgi:hypothetical protein
MSNFKGWTSENLEAAQKAALSKRLDKAAKAPTKKAVPHISTYSVKVGIDPGTSTGIAIKDGDTFKSVQTMTIIEAIEIVKNLHRGYDGNIFLRIEDARLRTFFGKSGPERWKGAGSIIRDCRIWEAEMKRHNIPVQWVHPREVKETTAEQFKALTGWEGRTSIHAREAAWMII